MFVFNTAYLNEQSTATLKLSKGGIQIAS